MQAISNKKIIHLKYKTKKIARRELPSGQYKTYDAIFDRCGQDRLYTWVLTKTLAQDTGYNIGTIRNHLHALEKDFYIFRVKEKIFEYTENGKKRIIQNARIIHLCLFPERVKEENKKRIKELLDEAWKKRKSNEISQEEYLSIYEKYSPKLEE